VLEAVEELELEVHVVRHGRGPGLVLHDAGDAVADEAGLADADRVETELVDAVRVDGARVREAVVDVLQNHVIKARRRDDIHVAVRVLRPVLMREICQVHLR
jgi:hypothetical protein